MLCQKHLPINGPTKSKCALTHSDLAFFQGCIGAVAGII